MDLKTIMNHGVFGVIIEGIGFLLAIGAAGYMVLGGGLGEYAKVFARALCG